MRLRNSLQFLDLNGKDVAQNREYFESRTKTLSHKLGIPMISGSDTHQAVQYGCICTDLKKTVKTVKNLYKEMQKGDYNIVVSESASFQVKTAGILKKALKEIHALGGDYVSVLTSQTNG